MIVKVNPRNVKYSEKFVDIKKHLMAGLTTHIAYWYKIVR